MKKRALMSVFLITFCVTLLCIAIIVIADYVTTHDITHIWAYVATLVIIPIVVTLSVMRVVKNDIIDPINDIDIGNPDSSDIYAEFTPLVDKIKSQNAMIMQQIHQINNEHSTRDKLRREFTANVSHELKTPLTSISGYAEIIRDGIARPEDTLPFAGKIYDESQRLITLVQDIIKLSHLEENDITKPEMEDVDLKQLCKDVIDRLEPIASKKGVSFELLGEDAHISAVRQVVQEMVYNLCDNAVKYNKDNGKVTVTIHQFVDGVELSVRDTGIGIPKDEVNRIFERFYRVDKSHSNEIGGTGLGLSIVKHGALYHGASITVDSELSVGTTIKILF